MKPFKNEHCNAVLKAEGCKDLPVRRVEYRVVGSASDQKASVKWTTWWEVSHEDMIQFERAMRAGETPLVRLDVFAGGHPPVLMQVEQIYPEDDADEQQQRVCRVCGCTDLAGCVDERGDPCFWLKPRLCSACADKMSPDEILATENAGDEAVLPNAITPAGGEWPRK